MVKIKIALLCNGYGVTSRGAERFTEEFYNHMKDIYDIDIISIKDTNTKFRDDFNIPWRNGRAYLESWSFGKSFYKNFKKNDYDLIFNNAGFPCSYWCNKIRKEHGVPFVTRARGGGKEEKISKWFKPNHMIFLSEYHQKKIQKKNSSVIPNAIDVDKYDKCKGISKLVEGLERPIFLSTSALVAFKRVDLIIDAVFRLERGSIIQTSDGDLRDEWVDNGHGLLGDNFRYVGKIPRDELVKLYKSCDVFVMASKKEAFGVVYLEAMAAGLPVVTQYDKRRMEIIGDAGILVNCKNIGEFSDALDIASENDWKNKPIEQAKQYGWDAIKKRYVNLISEVIK